MRFEVRITEAAWASAARIYEWIRNKQLAPLGAHRWFNGWLDRVQSLTTFPEGRSHARENGVIPNVEVFQQLFGEFRTLYVVRGTTVFVLHVRRSSRKPATLAELLPGLEEVDQGGEF